MGERGICNKDVNTRNFIVKCSSDGPEQKQVFMVDIGESAFRDQMVRRSQVRVTASRRTRGKYHRACDGEGVRERVKS
jgi:hypothetical protein